MRKFWPRLTVTTMNGGTYRRHLTVTTYSRWGCTTDAIFRTVLAELARRQA